MPVSLLTRACAAFALLLAFTVAKAYGQASLSPRPDHGWQPIDRVVRVTGWEIPGLADAIGVEVVSTSVFGECTCTVSKLLRPTNRLVTLPVYSLSPDGTLRAEEAKYLLIGLSAYSCNARVFAFVAEAQCISIDSNTGQITHLGCMVEDVFADCDGDGLFEVSAPALSIPLPPPWMAAWCGVGEPAAPISLESTAPQGVLSPVPIATERALCTHVSAESKAGLLPNAARGAFPAATPTSPTR